jgi:hypothetical protein
MPAVPQHQPVAYPLRFKSGLGKLTRSRKSDCTEDCVARRRPGVDGGRAYETRAAGVVRVEHAAQSNPCGGVPLS